FFVGTAPSGSDGLVNISPKGYRDCFAVIDGHTVAYLDLFGSGAETIAHLKENGRIVVMFCSFTRNSRILRMHGHGRVLRADDAAPDRYRRAAWWPLACWTKEISTSLPEARSRASHGSTGVHTSRSSASRIALGVYRRASSKRFTATTNGMCRR